MGLGARKDSAIRLSGVTVMPAGRPTDYTPELAADICSRLASGDSLRTVCKDEAMPSRSSVFLWIGKYPEFSDQYAKAKEEAAEALAEEMFDIADNSNNDWMEQHSEDAGLAAYKLNGENIQRSKLRVDVRKWYLSKIKPKKYGDKISQEVSGPGGGPVNHSITVEFVDAGQHTDSE